MVCVFRVFVCYYGLVDVICELNRSFLSSLTSYMTTVFIYFGYSEELLVSMESAILYDHVFHRHLTESSA